MKIVVSCLFFCTVAFSTVAWADNLKGTVVAYDRVAKRLVLSDKTILELGLTEVPATLGAGDEVEIDFLSAGDSGFGKITGVTILAEGAGN